MNQLCFLLRTYGHRLDKQRYGSVPKRLLGPIKEGNQFSYYGSVVQLYFLLGTIFSVVITESRVNTRSSFPI